MSEPVPPFQVAVIPVTDFQQNASLLIDTASRRAAVVDPGGDADLLMAGIEKAGLTVEKILLTHGHLDHAGGVADLNAALAMRQGAAVPVEGPHRADEVMMSAIERTAAQYGVTGMKNATSDRWLADGDTVTVGGQTFEVRHCPGHSPGSVIFYHADAGFIIMGDVLFAGSIGRTDLPFGDHATLIRSIREKVLTLPDDVTFLPGHGPMSTIGEERATNPFIR